MPILRPGSISPTTGPEFGRIDGAIEIDHVGLGRFWLYFDGHSQAPFCENETHPRGIDSDRSAQGFFKDGIGDEDARNVQRQALAGMLWSKQFFYYDISKWLEGDPGKPPPPSERRYGSNSEWFHLNNADVISMPDKWEYP